MDTQIIITMITSSKAKYNSAICCIIHTCASPPEKSRFHRLNCVGRASQGSKVLGVITVLPSCLPVIL